MGKILIVRLSAMGDILNSLPVAAALLQAYPNATIDWVIEERWLELLRARGTAANGPRSPQKPLVNSIFTVNTRKWRHRPLSTETRHQILELRHNLRESHYTSVIDVQGAIRSAVIARMSSCPRVLGFEKPREGPAKYLYTNRVKAQGTHIVEQNVSLASLPVPQRNPEILPCDPAAESWCEAELKKFNSNKFAILNPGAGWGAKEWPPERYGEIACELAKDGISSVLNIGPNEDDLAEKVESISNGSTHRVSCSIGELIALMRRASLFIGGDTGPMHLANLLGIPVLAIFGPTNPARNGPYYQRFIVLRHEDSHTSYSHHDREHAGLMSITAPEVTAAARKLLNQ
jgi:heptosyltransferase-1